MRPYHRCALLLGITGASLVVAGGANAQLDVNPPLPNVLLLVDTSGSMEYLPDGTAVKCDYADSEATGTSQKSRWTQLVEVMTGDVQNYKCYSQDRRTTAFRDEFALGGNYSYDYNYLVPYHRILSGASGNNCTIAPGTADPNAFAWGAAPFKYHRQNSVGTACAPSDFAQSSSGLLDSFRDRARFGLMTFDTVPNAGTGVTGTTTPNYPTGIAGSWSYFLGWQSDLDCGKGTCARGAPNGCATKSDFEVGARNAAAPPWEGRMVPFGPPTASIGDVENTNDKIQQVLLAVRPYGGTPINGMLADARDFLLNDASDDKINGGSCTGSTGAGCFGPMKDEFVDQGCRKNFVILLTDGEPNLDMRTACEGPADTCPYKDKSEDIVTALASNKNPIKTFVIGFAVSTPIPTGGVTPVDCSKISQDATDSSSAVFDPGGLCAKADDKLSACCTLAKIAYKGGTTNAHFASNANELRSAVSDILSQIAGSSTSRTMPVFASGASSSKFAGAYAFNSSFVAATGTLWQGVLERRRTVCTSVTAGNVTTVQPVVQDFDPLKGDDFAANLNSGDASHPRHYYTVIPDPDGAGKVWTDRSIRPSIPAANPDNAGTQGGTPTDGDDTNFFAPKINAKAMNVALADCQNPTASSADDCAARFMKWEIGVANGTLPNRTGKVFGDIYHSTPALVAPPSDFLRDESYTDFALAMQARPLMLYGATNDGQLHAFKVDKSPADPSDTFTIDKKVNNELWSFFPPAVLPRIATQYSSTHQVLLDGAPVVKDVVFIRTAADAKSGGSSASWHTVLVAGFGAGGGGYYALDITKPVPKTGATDTGPRLLWQLTTDSSGNRLFGTRAGTPAIATLYFDPTGGSDPKEYAVAILPGGQAEGPLPAANTHSVPVTMVDSAYPARTQVRSWNNDPARSVTIVRLDTGEIVRTFRDPTTDGPSSILARAKDTAGAYSKLLAPMSGQPVVFPSTTGVVSDRAFIGDRDGILWRMDLSSADPKGWKINLWFDAYTGGAFNVGQPIATPPILSVDNFGAVTVDFSTGDQETFLATAGMKNYLWSLKEDATASPAFKSKVQWFTAYKDGERVSGPMALLASQLYYTTFTPTPLDPTKVCSAGNSKLCGVHYLNPKTADKPDSGPTPNKQLTGSDTDPCISLGENTLAFGPGITQQPTCTADGAYDDPYLGFGTHRTLGLGGSSGGQFQLVVHTGSGGKAASGAKTNVKTVDLETPISTTRIDSWAGVIE